MDMSEREREYHRNYYHRVRRARDLTRIAIESNMCWICDLAPGTAHWGPRDILCCGPCLAKVIEAHSEQQDRDQGVKRYIDALDQDAQAMWAGGKLVHIIEKGQGGVWGELGELAEIPGIEALCGILSPPGPMRFDLLQPKELRRWPICQRCLAIYVDPAGLETNENNCFGYALPTTAALAPDTVPVT